MSASEPASKFHSADDPFVQQGWHALLSAARLMRQEGEPRQVTTFTADPVRGLRPVANASAESLLQWQPSRGWVACAQATPAAMRLFDLYLPLCEASARTPKTVAHLGQSLDGYIATSSGDSNYINGPENLLHLHRMRALCDAVVVGAETIATDDPQLTTRRAPGDNPTRVILDPWRRLPSTHGVFSDGAAKTLLVCDESRVSGESETFGTAEVLGVSMHDDGLDLERLLEGLHARRLHAIFVEGGGKTVSAFLEQGLLDRLQVAVAPLVIGSGRPGVRLAAPEKLRDCVRLSHRVFSMGDDVLFDCDLRCDIDASVDEQPSMAPLQRIT